jgi:hypothetical protein
LEDSAYTGDSTRWDLRLFDIQVTTSLVLNQSISGTELPTGSYIEGRNSGAAGYSVSAGAGVDGVIKVNQTGGDFVIGEEISVNGVPSSRTIGIITSFNTLGRKCDWCI